MGRPPGSRNRGKAPTPTGRRTTKPTPDNPKVSVMSNGPTAEEKRQYLEDYRKRRRTLADMMAEIAQVRGGIRSTLKAFENKGGSPKMLRRMWELTDMSKGEAEAEVAEYLGYAIDIGVRVVYDAKGQGGLADVLERPPPKPSAKAQQDLAAARSYSDGWNSASHGGTISDNPKRVGSLEAQQWAQGMSDYIWEQENGRSPGDAPAGAATPNGPVADLPPDPA